jgi:hypothetical protein
MGGNEKFIQNFCWKNLREKNLGNLLASVRIILKRIMKNRTRGCGLNSTG